MTTYYLQKLASHLSVRIRAAKANPTVSELLAGLVKHALPNTTDEQIAETLKKRDCCGPMQIDSALSRQEGLDLFEDVLEKDDHIDLKKKVTRQRQERARRKPDAPAQPEPQSQQVSRCWQVRPMPTQGHWTLDEAREYMPRVAGARLTQDLKRFSRWCAHYPRDEVPRNVTKSWGSQSGMTPQQALVFVLSTVWSWHTESTIEPCPHSWPADG